MFSDIQATKEETKLFDNINFCVCTPVAFSCTFLEGKHWGGGWGWGWLDVYTVNGACLSVHMTLNPHITHILA